MEGLAGFVVKPICDITTAMYNTMLASFIENIGAYFRIHALRIHPEDNNNALHFEDHDGLVPLKRMFEEQKSGTFVLCAVKGAGKTCSWNWLGRGRSHVLLLQLRCPKQPLSLTTWLNRDVLGLTHRTEQSFSEHVRNAFGDSFFVTLILSDFDHPMSADSDQALEFLTDLHRDSVRSGAFNVLVESNDTSNAHAILDHFRGEARWIPLEWSDIGARDYADHHPPTLHVSPRHLVQTGSVTRASARLLDVVPARVVYDEMDARLRREMRDRLCVFE